MKKFLLFMSALCLVLAINAQGVAPRKGAIRLKKVSTEQTIAKKSFTNAKSKALRTFKDLGKKPAKKAAVVKAADYSVTTGVYQKTFYPESNDWVHAMQSVDESQLFAFDIFGKEVVNGKTYSSANGDFDLTYTYYVDDANENGIDATAADFTYTKQENGQEDIIAHMTLTTGDTYTVTYHRDALPTPTENKTITIEDAAFGDYMNSYGVFLFAGQNDEYEAEVLCISSMLEGTYDIHQLAEAYVCKVGSEADVAFIDATVNVSVAGEDYICKIKGLGEDNIQYDITMIAPGAGSTKLDYDCTDQDFIYSFGPNDDIAVTDDYFEDWGCVYLDVLSADGSIGASLEFNVDKLDPEITIPEGTYEIDSSYDPGTVSASYGVDDWYLTGSFVTSYNEDGDCVDPIWFLTGGSVKIVNINGVLNASVTATNSCGRTISFTVDGTSGLETLDGESVIYNGGFEEWTSTTQPTGWEGWQIAEKSNTGGAKLEQSTDSHSGNYACFVKGDSSNKRIATKKMTLPADTYVVDFYAKSTNGGQIKPGYATEGLPSAIYVYGEFANAAIQLTNNWKRCTYEFTLDEETDLSMLVMIYKNSGDFLLDDYKVFSKTQAMGINAVKNVTPCSNATYSITGQKVSDNFKGVVIKNGKKFLMK